MPSLLRSIGFVVWVGCFAAGCNEARDRAYDVTVQNRTSRPLTIGVVKNGPPFEPRWAAPEDIAVAQPGARDVRWGEIVGAGDVGEIQTHGLFRPRVNAVLRIYDGRHTFYELLAMGRDDGGRINLLIPEGRSAVAVIDGPVGLEARRLRPGALPPPVQQNVLPP